MNKTITQYSIIFTLSLVMVEHSYALGYTEVGELTKQPSLPSTRPLILSNQISKLRTFISCYSGYDGSPLDCKFSLKVNGLKSSVPPLSDAENNGGHYHGYDTRNHTFYGKKLQYDADQADQAGQELLVVGSTLSTPPLDSAIVTHELPVVSGNIEVETFITTSTGWVCASKCYTRNMWRNLWTYNIQIKDLSLFPSVSTGTPYRNEGDTYVLDRGDGPQDFGGHPYLEGYYGAVGTIQLLPLIAENYFLIKGKKLRINDISLRKGGYFDISGTWKSKTGNPIKGNTIEWQGGHNSHREGKDVDISRDEIGNIDCDIDTDFHLAVDGILPPLRTVQYKAWKGKPTAVLCESGGRKHIDFELNQ